jgi:hypothetical protein
MNRADYPVRKTALLPPCHPEVADAPAPPPKRLRLSSEGGKPLWRRQERSDEGSAPENIEGHESRSFASSYAEASEDRPLRACPELVGIHRSNRGRSFAALRMTGTVGAKG